MRKRVCVLRLVNIGVRTAEEVITAACDYAKIACDSIYNSPEDICTYNESLERKIEDDDYVVQNFDKVMQNKHIKVYYQPVVRT